MEKRLRKTGGARGASKEKPKDNAQERDNNRPDRPDIGKRRETMPLMDIINTPSNNHIIKHTYRDRRSGILAVMV